MLVVPCDRNLNFATIMLVVKVKVVRHSMVSLRRVHQQSFLCRFIELNESSVPSKAVCNSIHLQCN